jgi:2,4-didehydro-3-deoxy-L-rhamnonate hydrolase
VFRLADVAGRAALIEGDHWFDLAGLSGDHAMADPMVAVARHRDLHALQERAAGTAPDGTVDPAVLGPPVPRPGQVFAIGLNYRSHAEESGMPLPPAPLTFTKFPSCLTGPDGEIELSGASVDWEVELVAVIGTSARAVTATDAWDHVAGLTLGQDVSDREVQLTGSPAQFSLGKSFAGYGPIGPALVSVDAFGDPDDIGLWCDVTGERMQDGRTSDLVFGVPALVEYLSGICTLGPGDLIFTGTPSGVGMGRGRMLAPGDVIDSGAEVIGTMRHRCIGGR